jgi:2,3-bisphosphoglycerate-dependent phosphoglycerate mutase
MLKGAILAGLIVATTATGALAQTTIFLVRHAERADSGAGGMASDPVLSAAGRARAARLAAMLKDTKLTAVFATEFKRTQQTAAPTAKAQHLTVSTVPADETSALVNKLKAATGSVLVVGHSNTVPEVMAALGVTPPVKIDDAEFDNLFIVVTGTPPRLVRLRYK